MKNFFKTKKRIWVPLASLLLFAGMVLSVQLLPFTNAKYVTGFEVEDTGISGVSDADLDELLRYFLEQRFPVGSVYMTASASLATETLMNNHFNQYGNSMSWVRIGQKQVPVGYAATGAIDSTVTPPVSFSNFFDAVPKQGGTGGGTGTGTYTITGNVTANNTNLTPGGVTWSPTGSLSLPDSLYAVTLTNGPTTLTGTGNYPLVSHTHNYSFGSGQKNIGGKTCSSPCGSGSTSGIITSPAIGGTNPAASIINNSTDTNGTPVTVTSTAPNITNAPRYTNPTGVTLKNPTWDYADQAISGFPLSFSYGPAQATITDKTMQPYITCHIFMRQS